MIAALLFVASPKQDLNFVKHSSLDWWSFVTLQDVRVIFVVDVVGSVGMVTKNVMLVVGCCAGC